jgi:hypothetical protein
MRILDGKSTTLTDFYTSRGHINMYDLKLETIFFLKKNDN